MAGTHFRNASWSALSAGIRAAAGLLAVLLAIRLLGRDTYGQVATWLSLFVLYLSFNSSVFTMLVVTLMAAGNERLPAERDEAVAVAARFCLWSLGLLAAIAGFLSTAALTGRLPFGATPEVFSRLIPVMAILTGIQVVVALHAAIVESAGRLDLATKSQLAGPLVVTAILAMALLVRHSIGASTYMAVLCLGSATDLAILWQVRRALRLRLPLTDRLSGSQGGVLRLLKAGGLLQGASLLNLFLEPANKFLLSHFAGSASVAVYDLAMKLVWGIQHLVGSAMRIFLHIGVQDRAAIGKTFARAISLLGVPVVTLHTFGALILLWAARYWMSIDAYDPMLFFGIATLSNLGMIFVTPLYLSLIASQDLVFVFRTQAILATINVLASATAIPLLGLEGAALGLLTATLLNAVAIYLRCKKKWGMFIADQPAPLRVKASLLLSAALLIMTIAWGARGGMGSVAIVIDVVALCALLWREQLVERIASQFLPGIRQGNNAHIE